MTARSTPAPDPDRSWGGADLDLDAYLARIGYRGPLAPTEETLRGLHRAHLAAIPFENVSVLLGEQPRLDLKSVQDKLVRRERGGYCYEHNGLFAAVAERVGFGVACLAARVSVGAHGLRPATHVVLAVVDLQGMAWVADVGFGGTGLLEPIRLADGAREQQGDRGFSVHRVDAGEWVLRTTTDEQTTDLYSFTLEPRYRVDHEVGNYYTATHPDSPFVRGLTAQRTSAGERSVLRGTRLVTSRAGGEEAVELAPAEVSTVLADVFGIVLEPAEAAALAGKVEAAAQD
ncbi:arylamine N-acetyltransferase family protein [Nocardiopsis ansamitocini]|uniref:Arylamine N-acetyltransferase n=1 Tax=Nocardiopsis ansamitocini TaxID=1670832 RepID=A0A9W6P9K3_9ACTN|nr:arylamine N-acetyltransferase [Nocardiopsis ansamitocini]GLU49631.1 arylamine N-acetyltransferase [Nocardiopsis ansamitocini]